MCASVWLASLPCGVCVRACVRISTHSHCDYKLEEDVINDTATLGSSDGVERTSHNKHHCQWEGNGGINTYIHTRTYTYSTCMYIRVHVYSHMSVCSAHHLVHNTHTHRGR